MEMISQKCYSSMVSIYRIETCSVWHFILVSTSCKKIKSEWKWEVIQFKADAIKIRLTQFLSLFDNRWFVLFSRQGKPSYPETNTQRRWELGSQFLQEWVHLSSFQTYDWVENVPLQYINVWVFLTYDISIGHISTSRYRLICNYCL
jgi:hypothetical protein